MKDLRTRRAADLAVDLDGPDGWNRGGAWESQGSLRPGVLDAEASLGNDLRPR